MGRLVRKLSRGTVTRLIRDGVDYAEVGCRSGPGGRPVAFVRGAHPLDADVEVGSHIAVDSDLLIEVLEGSSPPWFWVRVAFDGPERWAFVAVEAP